MKEYVQPGGASGPEEHPVHGTLLYLGEHEPETVHGTFRVRIFLNLHTQNFVLALFRGDVRSPAPLLARVHSSCVTSETFGGCDCDCAGQLDAAMEAIARQGRGAVFYLMQEGRGAGFVAKARDRMIVQASRDRVTTFEAYERMGLGHDHRRYDEVRFACALMGIAAPLRLMTNNPEKVAALERAHVAIESAVPLQRESSPFNRHYLAAKSRCGHVLPDPSRTVGTAALPEKVEYFEPRPLAECPRFVRMASYLLPIRPPGSNEGPYWFRLHVYFDLTTSRERVIFTYGQRRSATPLLRVQPESLFERFPLGNGGARAAHWGASIQHMARRGCGCALFVLYDDPAASFGRAALSRSLTGHPAGLISAAEDDDVVWLLTEHLPGGRAQPLIDGPRESERDVALRRSLKARGIQLLDPVSLHPIAGPNRRAERRKQKVAS